MSDALDGVSKTEHPLANEDTCWEREFSGGFDKDDTSKEDPLEMNGERTGRDGAVDDVT